MRQAVAATLMLVVALLAWLLWPRAAPKHEGTARLPATKATAASPSATRAANAPKAASAGHSAAPAQARSDGGTLLADPVGAAQEIDRARDVMTTAAHACYGVAGRLDPTQSLRVRAAIVVDGGRARIDGVDVVEGTLTDERARKCILGGFAGATWPSPGADRRLSVELTFTLAGLLH